MSGNFVVVSKEEAIRKIMEAPGDTVIIGKILINEQSYCTHDKPVRSNKRDGEKLIIAANEIGYQNNDYFGTLSLHGAKEKEEDEEESVIHSILFPQLE